MRTLILSIACIMPVLAQQGVGKLYGTRDPVTCASTKEPSRGVPSAAQVAQYVRCSVEKKSGDYLMLTENVKVEIAKGRPFQPGSDILPDGDTTLPLYPIRGSMTRFTCSQASDYMKNKGKNCLIWVEPKASGICYKTTFGDWNCSMSDLNPQKSYDQPPPTQ